MRQRVVLGLTVALVLPLTLPGASSARPVPLNEVYTIRPDARSPQGHLRLGISHSGVGGRAVLQLPEDRVDFPNKRRAQYWLIEPSGVGSGTVHFRNVYSDKCLTVARPEHSPVYLQYCGSILGQAWTAPSFARHKLASANRRPLGNPDQMCLDITRFRNAPGTRLQVGECHNKWNQQWRAKLVPAHLR